MADGAAPFAAAVRSRLDGHADPARAAQAQAYLKHELGHLGVPVPMVRAAVRDALRAADPPLTDRTTVLAAVADLWGRPTFEEKLAAVELLAARTDLVTVADLPQVETMLRSAGTWALVDPLAAGVVGRLVLRDPDDPVLTAALEGWVVDADFWLRRSALLSQLGRARAADAGPGDFAPFARWADSMLDEREFFVRKAIGWVLREVAKQHPDRVVEYVRPRVARMSGVTFREAVRMLPAGDAAQLQALRDAGHGSSR